MRLYNILYDPYMQRQLFSGPEGRYYTIVNGVPTPTAEALAMYSGEDERYEEIGIGGLVDTPFQFLHFDGILSDGFPVSVFEIKDTKIAGLSPLLKDYSNHYGVDYPVQAAYKLVQSGQAYDWSKTYGTELVASAMADLPMDIARIMTRCNDILQAAIADLVMAETDAEFNSMRDRCIADMTAANEAEAWEWCNTEFIKTTERFKPIMVY